MTISSTLRRAGPFTGNSIVTTFPFAFKVFDKTNVLAVRTDSNAAGAQTVLVLDSDYSVTINADQKASPGGTITYPITGTGYLSSTQQLTVIGSLAYLQPTALTNAGGFYPAVVEDALDREVILSQQLQEIVSRAIVLPITESNPPVLPPAPQRGNTIFGFDALGNLSLMPITVSVGAGALTPEVKVNGIDFTAGTSTSVTLGKAYGSKANLGTVVMAGIPQNPNSYSLNGLILTFDAIIPLGVDAIWLFGGTTLSIYLPPDQSVTDAKVALGSRLYNRTHGVVDVTDPEFGAKGDGSTDDTAAFQAAIATGLPVYIPRPAVAFYIKVGGINCTTAGQKIFGAGKDVSILKLDASSNLAATGLFISTIAAGGEGPQFSDFQVRYVQPDTVTRSALTTYPVTFYSQACQRATWTNMKVQNASFIIDLRNNPGGNNILGCEFSWYNIGVNIDGAVDSVKIAHCHFWPFGMTANQQQIFYDQSCTGISTGRMDDLHVDSCLFLCGKQIVSYLGAAGPTFGNITNCDFDSNTGITVAAGSLGVSACFFSAGMAAINQSIIMTGGVISASDCTFAVGGTQSNAQISIQGGGAIFQLSNSSMAPGGADQSSVAMAANTTVMLNNNSFAVTAGFSRVAPVVVQIGGVLTFSGNRISAKGGGTGTFLAVSTDDAHIISGNSFNGWGVTMPATMNSFMPSDNQGIAGGDMANGWVVGLIKSRYLTGITTAGGAISLPHGVGALHQKVLNCAIASRNGGGAWAPMTGVAVDGVNITASGGTASAAVRAFIQYTETQQGW